MSKKRHRGWTRQPDDFEHMDMRAWPLTPEQQLLNVADSLIDQLSSRAHRYRQSGIRSTAIQLREMLAKYLDGQLPPIQKSDCPF